MGVLLSYIPIVPIDCPINADCPASPMDWWQSHTLLATVLAVALFAVVGLVVALLLKKFAKTSRRRLIIAVVLVTLGLLAAYALMQLFKQCGMDAAHVTCLGDAPGTCEGGYACHIPASLYGLWLMPVAGVVVYWVAATMKRVKP